MKLTNSDIRQFQDLYAKHFGIELNKHEASLKLSLLVKQLEVIYRPITKGQFDNLLCGDRNGSRTPKTDR